MPLVGNRSVAIRRGKARPERVQRRNAQRKRGLERCPGGSSACLRALAAARPRARSGVIEQYACDTVRHKRVAPTGGTHPLTKAEGSQQKEVAGYACQSPSLSFSGEGPAGGDNQIFCGVQSITATCLDKGFVACSSINASMTRPRQRLR